MLTTVDLVERSGMLKRDLVEFARQPRYRRAFLEMLSAQGQRDRILRDESTLIEYLDFFVLQHRFPDGGTLINRFVAARPDLSAHDRDLLSGWHDVVQGLFEVVRHDGDAVVWTNLLDELTYRVRSNLGPAVFRSFDRGCVVMARIVPAGGDWVVSGVLQPLGKRPHREVYEAAAELAMQHPEWVFRNPKLLQRGWETQRAERERFIRFFGSDMVLIPGRELAARMQGYLAFSRHEILTLPGNGHVQESYAGRPVPTFDLPPRLVESDMVAVIYDEIEGLSFFGGFDMIERAFANPKLVDQIRYRQRLLDYLDDRSVSPLPFRRLAERDAERLSEVLRRALRRPRFDWHRDGETLMRKRKAWFFDRPSLPRVLPLGAKLSSQLSPG